MSDVLEFHAAHRLVPVVVVDRVDRALPLAETLSSCGLPSAEVTLRTPGRPVRHLGHGGTSRLRGRRGNRRPSRAGGAGRRRRRPLPRLARLQRGRRPRVPQLDVLLVPGVATATELQTVLEAGRDVVKFFPAAAAGGAAMMAALSATVPLRSVRADRRHPRPATSADYLRLPSVLAVGGTWLAPRAVIDAGDFEPIARETPVRRPRWWSSCDDPRPPRARGLRLRRGLARRGDAPPGSRRGQDPHGAGVPGLGRRRGVQRRPWPGPLLRAQDGDRHLARRQRGRPPGRGAGARRRASTRAGSPGSRTTASDATSATGSTSPSVASGCVAPRGSRTVVGARRASCGPGTPTGSTCSARWGCGGSTPAASSPACRPGPRTS